MLKIKCNIYLNFFVILAHSSTIIINSVQMVEIKRNHYDPTGKNIKQDTPCLSSIIYSVSRVSESWVTWWFWDQAFWQTKWMYLCALRSLAESPERWNLEFQPDDIFADNLFIFADNFYILPAKFFINVDKHKNC